MDEVWVRAGLILGALSVATVGVRRRTRHVPRRLDATKLTAGVYLMSSGSCPDCGPVRRQLDETLGQDGYSEMSWDTEPGVFEDLGITAVPVTLIVADDGSGVAWPGRPDKALAGLGP